MKIKNQGAAKTRGFLRNKEMHSQFRRRSVTVAIACALTLGFAGEAWSAPAGVSISKVVDTETLAPTCVYDSDTEDSDSEPPINDQRKFRSFNNAAISGDEVVFFGSNKPQSGGIYTSLSGALNCIEYRSTHMRPFYEPSVSEGTVAYRTEVHGHFGGSYDIKVASNGTLTTIAHGGWSRHSGDSYGFDPTVSDGRVAFSQRFLNVPSAITGVYLYDSKTSEPSVAPLVTINDAIPSGTGNFTRFDETSISADLVAFLGYGDSQRGIYIKDILSPSQPVKLVVDSTAPIPRGTRSFGEFGKPSLYGDKVAFHGIESSVPESNALEGIYTAQGNTLNVVVDSNTAIPNGGGNFTGFGDPSLDNGLLAFFASDSNGGGGIYLDREEVKQNPLLKVIALGDQIDGKTITGLNFIRGGLSGNKLAFVATFSDDSSGVYKAEVATMKDQCKNGGYTKFGFKNQGQCIQFVNTGF